MAGCCQAYAEGHACCCKVTSIVFLLLGLAVAIAGVILIATNPPGGPPDYDIVPSPDGSSITIRDNNET